MSSLLTPPLDKLLFQLPGAQSGMHTGALPEHAHLSSEGRRDCPTIQREIQGTDQGLEDKTIILTRCSTSALVHIAVCSNEEQRNTGLLDITFLSLQRALQLPGDYRWDVP